MTLTPEWLNATRPRSAYVHVPFCKHRCGYCNFTLVAGRDDLVEAYLECIEIELTTRLQSPQSVKTLFLGGGTPTHLTIPQLRRLLELLAYWLPLDDQPEFSCEANPLDCGRDKLLLLRDSGVNRISLGGQSFNDHKLLRLERDHSGKELSQTIELTCELFNNVALDLIFAAPEETLADWQTDLAQSQQMPISHLSTYGLTIEPGANFWGRMLRGNIEEVDADLQLAMYHHTMDSLAQAGWQHYEVSNFARLGYQCQHNQAYWQGVPWWAFGPGASSFLPSDLDLSESQNPEQSVVASQKMSRAESRRWLRATNHRSTTQYIRLIQTGRSAIHECDELDLEQVIRERLVFGLRQLAGVDLNELTRQWGNSIDELFAPFLDQYIADGWLELGQGRLRLTRKGLVISDSLWPNLLG